MKCTAKKLFSKNQRHAAQKAKAKLTVGVMTVPKCSVGGCACRHDSLETEDGGSPLTTPPSSPVPSESCPMEAILMGSQEAAEHFGVPYTHNRVSTLVLITFFVDVYTPLVLLFLSGRWNSLLLQPMQKGGVHVVPHRARKIQGRCHRRWCHILLSWLS